MEFESLSFGSVRVDGIAYESDVLIDRGEVHERRKKPSKKFCDQFGHTPLSVEEKIPWKCRRLVIGTPVGASFYIASSYRDPSHPRMNESRQFHAAQGWQFRWATCLPRPAPYRICPSMV